MKPDFSVAIPAFNSAPYIGETLESILIQTYPPKEVVVANDGSTDDTGFIARQFGDRVRIIDIENSGPGNARKTAVEACTCSWIATCDSDDIWLPDHLERRVGLIECFPNVTFTFSDCSAFGPGAIANYSRFAEAPPDWLSSHTHKRINEFMLLEQPYLACLHFNPAFVSGWVFRSDAYRKMGGIDPRFSRTTAEDTEFLRRFLLNPESIVAADTRITWSYRRHTANTSAVQWKNIFGKAQILETHLREEIIPPELESAVRDEALRTRIQACNMAYWEGDHIGAWNVYRTIPLLHRGLKPLLRIIYGFLRARARQS